MMIERYRPSGRFGPGTLAVLPVLAAMGIGSAWAYQWLIEIVPTWLRFSGKLSLLAALVLLAAFGGAIGGAGYLAIRIGKCRSPVLAVLSGMLLGVIAVGASHYIAYRHATTGRPGLAVKDYLGLRTQKGWVAGRSSRRQQASPTSTAELFVVWGLEAATVLVCGAIGGASAARRPFCEACYRWADRVVTEQSVRTPGAHAVVQLEKAESIVTLLELPAPGADAGGMVGKDVLIYTMRGCPTCDRMSTLTVVSKVVTAKKKKEETKTSTLWSHVVLSPQEAGMVKELVEGMAVAAWAAGERSRDA